MDVASLEALLTAGTDTAMLRLSIAQHYANQQQWEIAIGHLQQALEQQSDYTAAWSLLGKCLVASHQPTAAGKAYQQGIAAAEKNGDKQTEKAMRVFLRRLQK